MCGITGAYFKASNNSLEKYLKTSISKLVQRGPDNIGIKILNDKIGFAHSRLKIIDLSNHANQPFSNDDDSISLTFNGEIYNFKQLRDDLIKKGHKFNTLSDTEVLLKSYEEYGLKLLDYIKGMFAFAIFDKQKNIMFCARDPLGKKPFCYSENSFGTFFASQIPALKTFPGIDLKPDEIGLGLYLLRNFRHIPDPYSGYIGIKKLNPGHAMIIKDGIITNIWKYFNFNFNNLNKISHENILNDFDNAVSKRMVADVDIGALLSGGVDSTAIVYSMIRQGKKNIKTYAMGLNKDDDELKRARIASKLLNTEHKEYYFDGSSQHEIFIELLKQHGEPIMLLPLGFAYELCKHIKDDGIKVVMTGHGSDEIYYGYSGQNYQALLSNFSKLLPEPLLKFIFNLSFKLLKNNKIHEISNILREGPGKRKSSLYNYEAIKNWNKYFKNNLYSEKIINDLFMTCFNNSPPKDYIDEANIIGLLCENSHSITIAGDLPAMANGIEIRSPFLDQDLVKKAFTIPYNQKISYFPKQNKLILKKALESRIPKEILYASKKGFGYHIQEKDVLFGSWANKVNYAFNNKIDTLKDIFNLDYLINLKNDFYNNRNVPAITIAKLYAIIESYSLST